MANVPGIENQINLKMWVEGTGIPPDAIEPVSTLYKKVVSLANEFGKMPREDEVADWHGQEWELYLENLPKSVDPSQVHIVSVYLVVYCSNYYHFLCASTHSACPHIMLALCLLSIVSYDSLYMFVCSFLMLGLYQLGIC